MKYSPYYFVARAPLVVQLRTLDLLCRIAYNNKYNILNNGDDFMLAVNYSTIRNNLKDYCDKVTDEYETVIITRKGERNIVMMSLDEYNELTKAAKNAAYLDMIDKSMAQLAKGEGKVHELIEVD
jgi:antitoxin YefM